MAPVSSEVHFRPNTSDERVLKEVIENRCYRKAAINFDVDAGEHWLDLGANIGAFALYCKARSATAECYEPDAECFKLLKKNVPQFKCNRLAVTASKYSELNFYRAQSPTDYSRGTIFQINKFKPAGTVPNCYAGDLKKRTYDGVKMDVEGAEGPLLDLWLLPKCSKLVIEYHTSRDIVVEHFFRRIAALKQHFKHVSYPPEFDRIGAEKYERFERWIIAPELPKGGRFVQYPTADRLIFAWGAL